MDLDPSPALAEGCHQHRDSGALPGHSITVVAAHEHIVILHSFLQKYFDLNCSVSNDVF